MTEAPPTLAGRIRRDLYAIADNYDEALDPVRRSSGSHVKGSKEPPLPISAAVLDARREAIEDLTYWARFIIDEADVQHGPYSLDADVLVEFIVRWADWLEEKMPDDAENLADDAEKHAKALRGIVDPPRREWVTVGNCPLTVARDGERVECGTRVRAYPHIEFIRCRGCGHEDTRDWWRAKILGNRPRLVSAVDLTDILLIELQVHVEPETVRQWHKRGKAPRHGKDERGRWLYDWAEIVALIQAPREARTA